MERNFEYAEMIKEREEPKNMWCAGQNIEALRYYLKPTVNIIREYREHDYQGECYALLKYKEKFILWRASFGSCSGCDALEDRNGYDYIKNTMTEGNCKAFPNIPEMEKWILKNNDYLWNTLKENYKDWILSDKSEKGSE
ncbi:MAG: hypothetical protein ACYDAO_04405 [Thermoplasmataceae archaeon]